MTILLLDGYNLLFRSFSILPDSIVDAEGKPINAVYGLVASMLRLLRDRQPDRIVVAFDTPEVPNFRSQLYPLYQAQRGPLGGDRADEFADQVHVAQDVLPALGIPAPTAPGFEADDIMGTLAVRAADRGMDVIVVTTDRDALQLVRPHISILVPGKEDRLLSTGEAVRERMGVPPEGIVPFKALAGDPSDNIPGLPGIGTKTAVALVNEYATLDAIYDNLDRISPRSRRSLAEHADEARLFEKLVTIVTDLDVPLDVASLPQLAIAADAAVRPLLAAAGHPMAERKT